MEQISRHGIMLVISSPSGAGKTSIARALLESEPDLSMSVSLTTRKPRGNEIDGKDYRFVSHREFVELRDSGRLLESAEVFSNLYGSPVSPTREILAEGKDVLFDIDWQGAAKLRESELGHAVVGVFVLPPSLEELERRLRNRKTESPESLARRMKGARNEIIHYSEYRYVIINQELNKSIDSARKILHAERLKTALRTGLHRFVSTFKDVSR